jgi:hypothetical protein
VSDPPDGDELGPHPAAAAAASAMERAISNGGCVGLASMVLLGAGRARIEPKPPMIIRDVCHGLDWVL